MTALGTDDQYVVAPHISHISSRRILLSTKAQLGSGVFLSLIPVCAQTLTAVPSQPMRSDWLAEAL